jgi:hypothetical protein
MRWDIAMPLGVMLVLMLGCGEVDNDEARIDALEAQMASLSGQFAGLVAPGCSDAQVARRIAGAWQCSHETAYSDEQAVDAVRTAAEYVTTSGESTLTGDVTFAGHVNVGASELLFWKARFGSDGDVLKVTLPGGMENTVFIGGGAEATGTHIAFRPGSPGESDGAVFVNIEGSSGSCTMLHSDDDYGHDGFYVATDHGNQLESIWGNSETETFVLKRAGISGVPIDPNANYVIACF